MVKGGRATGEAIGIIARLAAKQFGKEATEVIARDLVQGAVEAAAKNVRQVPQGLTDRQFNKLARGARQLRRQAGLPDGDLVVQGSRARGTARAGSDLDVALRVDEQTFFDLSEQMLSRARLGTKLRERMLRRIRKNGQLSSFDLGHDFQNLRHTLLDPESPYDVQFSVLQIGGKLDTGPFIP
ncbi:putative nucleotidyltransferase [Actinoplanes octamycinicus]|uniref:Putative nucleotidyltransferase n=1 Tax=Actinoplanes octamycinicus TaxID=135948 RepID=A0A7W7GYU1_9ACTN|nr:nucleotidyltransferase domain-containing protein [Actinoplanes octamycinicus]MBB4740828.1 putative nucleotidyltransferase [Actinoplanes octamycinicus]GIE55731.1 hypothetical protein Aoc01nite_11330 [Actinoplanes octamycinicus]